MSLVTSQNISEIHRLDDDISKEIITNIQKILAEDDINFTGNMSKSVKPDILDGIRYVVIDSPYATVIDKGMPAGKNVNFDALKKWVEGKLGVPSEESTNVTLKIMNKIKSTGIQPRFFVKKALKMVIGKHGVITIRKQRQKKSRLEKFFSKATKMLNKTSRIMKKVGKTSNKITNNLNKVDRRLRSYG